MKNDPLTNNRGIALLITLAVITVLIAVGIEVNRRVRTYVETTHTSKTRTELVHLATSGVQVARALLVKDRTESETDHLLEDWAANKKIAALLASLSLKNEDLSVTISDELGRIQVNALVQYPERRQFNPSQQILWDQLLLTFSEQTEAFKDIEPTAIVNSVKDWLDTGDDDAITGLSGAESDYYQDLPTPYDCGNGPFRHIMELMLVKGISRELFYGTDTTPGIADYTTVFGLSQNENGQTSYTGKININTAGPEIIGAILPLEHKDAVKPIIDYRQQLIEDDNFGAFQTPDWYKDAAGGGEIEIDPNLLTVSSDLFRIEATASQDTVNLTVVAWVKREKQKKTGRWMCKTLQWDIK